MNAPYLILTLAVCFALNGCISGTIVASGKRYDHLLDSKTSVSDVHKSLGAPSWSETYEPPVRIESTKVFKSHQRAEHSRVPWVSNGTNNTRSAFTSLCEVHTRKGPYADPMRAQAYGMIGAMTLGVGDLAYLPKAIEERSEMNKELYSLTFWYDSKGRFIGLYRGDIREIPKPKKYITEQVGASNGG